MSESFNPFVPGRPVPADLFIGRVAQLDRLAQVARHSSTGRLNIGYLAGERGIGKTSLLAFLRQFLQRQFQVLGVHVFLSGADSLEEALHRIFDQILRTARHEGLAGGPELLRGHASSPRSSEDLTLRAPERELLAIGEHLDSVVHSLMQRLTPRYRGMMLVLDDINEVAASGSFAHWLKAFVDTASTSGAEPPLFLLLSGPDDSRRALMRENPSMDRLLQAETLGPWSEAEAAEFFRNAFSSSGRPVTPDAVRVMASFCNGRPAVAQKLGDATFRADKDAHITQDDAMSALFGMEERLGEKREPALDIQLEADEPLPAKAAAGAKGPNRQLLSVLRSLV